MIQYLSEDIPHPHIDREQTTRWIKRVAARHNRKVGNINYIFCSDDRILEVNRRYLQHDYYTDIITFDTGNGRLISGDIFISLDTVKSNAEGLNIGFDEELHRVIIHGILHLCGQADKTPEERTTMRQKEDDALMLLPTV